MFKRFRVFFTMNPKNGSLSRAMRNRSVEIYMDTTQIWSNAMNDSYNIVFGENLPLEPEYNAVGCLDPKELLKAASINDSFIKNEAFKKWNNVNDSNFDQLQKIRFKSLIQSPIIRKNIRESKRSLSKWTWMSWDRLSNEFPSSSLLLACSTTTLHGDMELNNLFSSLGNF